MLCAHWLQKIRGSIGPILFVIYMDMADAENNRCACPTPLLRACFKNKSSLHIFSTNFLNDRFLGFHPKKISFYLSKILMTFLSSTFLWFQALNI